MWGLKVYYHIDSGQSDRFFCYQNIWYTIQIRCLHIRRIPNCRHNRRRRQKQRCQTVRPSSRHMLPDSKLHKHRKKTKQLNKNVKNLQNIIRPVRNLHFSLQSIKNRNIKRHIIFIPKQNILRLDKIIILFFCQ